MRCSPGISFSATVILHNVHDLTQRKNNLKSILSAEDENVCTFRGVTQHWTDAEHTTGQLTHSHSTEPPPIRIEIDNCALKPLREAELL